MECKIELILFCKNNFSINLNCLRKQNNKNNEESTYNNGYENNIDLKKNHCHLKVAQQKNGFEKAGGTSNPLKMNKNNLGHSKTIESSTSSCNK